MTVSVVDVGNSYGLYTWHSTQAGKYARLTASGGVKTGGGQIIGFYVSNTTAGTLTLWDNTAASGTQISGLITPAIGFQWFPFIFFTGCFAQIGGTALDVTFVYL